MLEKLREKLRRVKAKLTKKLEEKASAPPPEEKPEKRPSRLSPKLRVKRALKKVAGVELSPSDLEDILWDLQVSLLESDVAVPVADEILSRVRGKLTGRRLGLGEDPKKVAEAVLEEAVREILEPPERVDLLERIRAKNERGEPAVLVFFGINGTGKTTTIAKLAKYLQDRGLRVVLAASDTFRAGGIEQLETHARRLGVELVKQRQGADAAAVAYDAISHARARGFHVVLVDTAGRMQTDRDLMDEMRKIVRVTQPDLRIFVGDALTGNDAVEQARSFNQEVGIDGSILCKMDADARGGAALSITYVTGKPILFLGTGQAYEDLVEFKPELILRSLLEEG
ncbi:MAG: signal recognition particle-docking protein FtsY [Hadesarchaea archaeon]|nr:signal recognition particle-docking protein FtsY [Hadesarchaea archaeon]